MSASPPRTRTRTLAFRFSDFIFNLVDVHHVEAVDDAEDGCPFC